MKKIVLCVTLVLTLLFGTLTVSAGDIHHAFLRDETALLFFGEVLEYHSNKEGSDISVSPMAVIKGDIPEDEPLIFDNPYICGEFKPKKGKIYLIGHLDKNNIYVLEVTAYDTQTLELKHVEGGVWDAFEQYLHEGKYGAAKLEGIEPDTAPSPFIGIYCILGGVACALIFVLITIYVKRKRYSNK